LSFQLVDLVTNFTTWSLNIDISGEVCDGGDNNRGPLCDDSQYHYFKLGDAPKDEKLDPSQTKYYILKEDDISVQIPKLRFAVSGAKGNISVLYRRGAFPTQGSHDAIATQQGNDTVADLSYPRKNEKYHIFSLTNVGKEAESIKINGTNVNATKAELTEINANELLKDAAQNTVDTKNTKSTDGETAFFVYKKTGDTNTLIVGVANDGDETPNVYIDTDGYPSAVSHLLSNTDIKEEVHLFSATADPTGTFSWYTLNTENVANNYTWYIGIEANNDYTIFVGDCARNCSGDKGTCNKATGICNCVDGREGYDCADRSFPILYIILIAIGSAIALAIAIAIPVFCYMKNRRNAGYERV